MFEIARVYLPEPEAGGTRSERQVLAAGAYGPRGEGWLAPEGETGFLDIKGVVEEVLALARITDCKFEPIEIPFLQPGRSAAVMIGDQRVAVLGEVHPEVADEFGIKESAVVFERTFRE